MNDIDTVMNVLDDDGETTEATVKLSVRPFDDVVIIEVGEGDHVVTVYVEKQGDRVGVYVGTGDDGRSDAMLSLRVDPTRNEYADLRYDRREVIIQSDASA
jgi:hypothetical protein